MANSRTIQELEAMEQFKKMLPKSNPYGAISRTGSGIARTMMGDFSPDPVEPKDTFERDIKAKLLLADLAHQDKMELEKTKAALKTEGSTGNVAVDAVLGLFGLNKGKDITGGQKVSEPEPPIKNGTAPPTTTVTDDLPTLEFPKEKFGLLSATPTSFKVGATAESGERTKAFGSALKKQWDKMAESQIAMSSLNPKINYMMEIGARGYRELRDKAANFGLDLNFEEGGLDYWQAQMAKGGLGFARLTPIMDAVSKLRPEIGFEVMRQIGPFRSAQAGLVFTETLPDFTGHIPSDIAKAVTTMTKSFAGALGNKELVKQELSSDEQVEKIGQFEANLIRSYNKTYRQMGVIDNFQGVGLSIEEIANNSKFTRTEESLINHYMDKHPDLSRQEMVVTLIDEGLL